MLKTFSPREIKELEHWIQFKWTTQKSTFKVDVIDNQYKIMVSQNPSQCSVKKLKCQLSTSLYASQNLYMQSNQQNLSLVSTRCDNAYTNISPYAIVKLK